MADKPLRIGIATDGLEQRVTDGDVRIANGGVGVYIYNLVKHLQLIDTNNEYVLVCCGRADLDIYRNGRMHTLSLPASAMSRVVRRLDLPYRRLTRDLKLDLLHFPNQFGGAFLPRRVKRVVTLHDITPLLFPRHHPTKRVLGYRLLMRRSLGAADCVIVDSACTREDLIDRALIPASKIVVIPLAAAADFRPGVRTSGFPQRYDLPDRFILTVGVLEPRKNHALLVDALRRLHAAGEQVGLVIVGRDGWKWSDPLAAASDLQAWVRTFRNVPDADLVELYNRAEVFAYPSLYEGFGLPMVEAMACGTPVVASNVSSLPEVAGKAALFADPTDAGDFAAQLLRVLRDARLHEQLAVDGRRQVAGLSWRRTAERTLAIYERVCADQDAG